MTQFEEMLSRARVMIMQKHNTVFLSSLLMNLNTQESKKVPTAGTDGINLYINPDFFTGLTKTQTLFLLAHEVYHVAWMHAVRRGDKDHKKWNRACDYVINLMLFDEGFDVIPHALISEAFRGMSADEVYSLLPDEPENENSLGDDLMEPEDMDEAVAKAQEMVARAVMQADMANQSGSVPGDVRNAVERYRNPVLPWYTILEQYMTDKVNDDYSWSQRNRRYMDVHMPSLYSEGIGEIRCYFDCSGSITDEELKKECAECYGIKDILNPSRMVLRAFSCSLGKEQVSERQEEIVFEADTSGGTDILPIFKDLLEHQPEVAIIFTDGEYFHPANDGIETDVIFVIVGNAGYTNPYGYKVIHMER